MEKQYKFHKLCKCCGLPFDTNSPQKLFCDREHYLPCPVCGKPVLKKDRDFTRKPTCCSVECSVKANQMHLPIKKCEICGKPFKAHSGVATICEREHHAPCVICGKDIIITKRMWHDKIDTCSRKCALEKLRRFYQEKYGVDHPMQSSEVQKRHRAAMKEKYGVEHALQSEKFLNAAYETNLKKFGTKYACLRPECHDVSPMPIISSNNKIFGKLLTNVGLTIEFEKVVNSRAFDIYVKDNNTLVEIDPTWDHNSYTSLWGSPPISTDYHLKKTQAAESGGYRCIHIFEWDAKEKVLDLFRPKQPVGARNCKLSYLSVEECNKFLITYHLQGRLYKQTYRIGLTYRGELIQVMTFGAPRYDKSYDAELLRLCTKSGIAVIGGAEKLFKQALKDNPEWKSVISYCDRAKFSGEVYTRMGMELKRKTPPQAIWSKGTDKITSTLLRQRGADQLIKTHYGKGTKNEDIMLQEGWLPVYDCGQLVYEYKR